MDLTLDRAIEIATSPRGNSQVQMAKEAEKLAHSHYAEARASLLPNLEGAVTEQNQTVNPSAMGLRFSNPQFAVPKEVGPFNTFDARVRLSQNLFNFSAIRHWQAEQQSERGTSAESESVRQRVAASVARLYAAALRADALIDAARANITDAEALRDLAVHRASAGEGTDLDVARAKLRLARDEQHRTAAEAERTRTQLELIQTLNLDWNTTLHLRGTLMSAAEPAPTAEEAVATALQSRAEFRAQASRTQSALLDHRAAWMERMPSLVGYADYGVLEGVQTHTVGASLRVPIFDGGRSDADRQQAAAVLRQQQIRQKEFRSKVELEVRQALVSLHSTGLQVEVAGQAVSVAEEELASARRRYEAGVTNSLEVVEAQTQLEAARDDRVAAMLSYTNARIDLAQATGTIAKLSF